MAEKRYYMACLDLEGRSCLVVGGGTVALEKAAGLLDCGARRDRRRARRSLDELRALDVEWLRAPYETADLDGRFLVIAATADDDVNRRVCADAEARGLLCNVADVPELCNFILPAVHRAGPIAIAVSTGGASPALAQRLRDEFAALVGARARRARARGSQALRPWAKATLRDLRGAAGLLPQLVEEALRRDASTSSAPARAIRA